MITELTRSPTGAADIIKRGGIVAFPTETVYGLGANVFDEDAIAKIFTAKMRPADNPLIAHISSIEQIRELASEITENARQLIDVFFPGPLTLVLSRREGVLLIATAGLDSIGIRMPRNELAREFLKACGTPVVAPSANLSGRPSPTTWQAVYEDLSGRINCILQGDQTEIGLESTVVDCRGEFPIVLRQGAVTVEGLRAVVPSTVSFDGGSADNARSPGLQHKHYSPNASVVIVQAGEEIESSEKSAIIGQSERRAVFGYALIAESTDDYAHSLFEFLRECDRRGIDTIYCEAVEESGIGVALMDRLRRAAES